MKKFTFISLFFLSALVTLGVTGCSKTRDDCCEITPPLTPWDGVSVAQPTSGNVTFGGVNYQVYNISEASELAWFAQMVNSGSAETRGRSINLTKDIDLGGKAWTPIGANMTLLENRPDITEAEYTASPLFTGSVFGNGHTVSNVYTGDVVSAARGLFGHVIGDLANPSVIDNIHVKNVVLNGEGKWSAGLVGYVSGVKQISRCSVESVFIKTGEATSSDTYYCGALVGFMSNNRNITISECSTRFIQYGDNGWNNSGFIGLLQGNNKVVIEDCVPSINFIKTSIPLNATVDGITYALGTQGANNSWFIGRIVKQNDFDLIINNVTNNGSNWSETNTLDQRDITTLGRVAAYNWPYITVYENNDQPLRTTITIDGVAAQ